MNGSLQTIFPDRPTLIVMVKAPVAGRVKTRLGRDIGMAKAAWWYRHQTARTLRALRDPRWQLVLSVAPDTAQGRFPLWPRALAQIPQGRGDLGARMARAMGHITRAPVLLIGSDIPGVTPRHIARGFASLGPSRAVFGPAEDGGYWLVGLARGALAHEAMFVNVRWSHAETLNDSLTALTALRPTLIDQLRDVDTKNDLIA